ncbi:MAG TPA: AAA family ATPase, partial [Myxococcota bacterium]
MRGTKAAGSVIERGPEGPLPIDPKKPVRPHDVRNVQFPPSRPVTAPVSEAATAGGEGERTREAQRLAYDVLDVAHQQVGDVAVDKVSPRGLERSLAAATAVSLTGTTLRLGTSSGDSAAFPLSADLASAMTLLPSNEPVLQALWAGERSSRVTLITAKAGAGAGHAASWLLRAIKPDRHAVVKLTRTTAPDQLVGALRPDEKQKIRVQDGPLTQMVRSGGTLVIDRLESASPEVLALLTPLASGAKTFPHPVSHEVIPVSPDFRLVLIGAPDRALPPNLLQACQKNAVHVTPYGAAEHVRLLVEQHKLPPQLAASLAAVHDQIANKPELDFGRNFPVTYGQLRRVALRLETLKHDGSLDKQAAGRAVFDIYGARLANASQKEMVRELLVGAGLDPGPSDKLRSSPSTGYVVTERLQEPLRQALTALHNNETLFLSGTGQTGITRLVDELAARRTQDVVTVPCHAGTDPQSLMEMPTFDESGHVYFKPGRLAQALLNGDLLCLDHIEFVPTERQNALFHLGELKTIRVVEEIKDAAGKVTGTRTVDKPVHPNARVVLCGMEESRRLSSLHPDDRPRTAGLHQPTAADRACATEVALPPARVDDVAALLPEQLPPDVRAAVLDVLGALFPSPRAVKV